MQSTNPNVLHRDPIETGVSSVLPSCGAVRNGPAITSPFLRLLAELHRDLLDPMMGKEAWVAGADRGEAPEPKPVRLGRRLRLRRQPPGSWQLCNGGVQRGVSLFSSDSERLPVHNSVGIRHLPIAREPLLSLARNRRIIVPPVEHRPQLEVRAESQGPSQGNREDDFSTTDETRMEHG